MGGGEGAGEGTAVVAARTTRRAIAIVEVRRPEREVSPVPEKSRRDLAGGGLPRAGPAAALQPSRKALGTTRTAKKVCHTIKL